MRIAAALYVFALHVVIAALWFHDGTRDRFVATTSQIQEWRDAQALDGSDVFLGDSITQGLVATNVSPGAVNLGIGWQTTSDLLAAIPHYKSLPRAHAIYLLIGINDLHRQRAGLENRLQAISDALPPVPLVWSGLLSHDDGINAEIRRICSARPKCTYIDVHLTHFVDGIHPNATGYKEWTKALITASPRQ